MPTTLFPWLPLFLLLFVLPFILIRKLRGEDQRKNGHLPPSPPTFPILGNIHQLGKLPHSSLWRLSLIYGPVMRIHLGRVETIVISSAEAARELMKTHDLESSSRPKRESSRKLTYNYLDVALSPYSDYWTEIRKICVLELFSVRRVKSYHSIREEEVGLMLDSISESASSATPVDLSEKLVALTASIIFRIAFGKRFQASDFRYGRIHELVSEVMAFLGSFSVSEYFPISFVGEIVDRVSGQHARLERVSNELDTLFQHVIDEHLLPERIKPEEDDIIDVFLAKKEEQAEELDTASVTHDDIKAVLLDIFLGGIHTSAITMVWAMAELVKNPKLMKKAQQEIRTLVGNNRKLTESDTDGLPYLKMIVKETLRLHPPAPLLIAREAISHFKLEGYDIYPKTMIQVNAWAIGRDPKYWSDPEEFIPERFADSSIDYKGQHFQLLPFGAGRRICPGMYMGVKNVELALASLLCYFDWKLPEGMMEKDLNMEEATGLSITVIKKVPLQLVPVRPSTM